MCWFSPHLSQQENNSNFCRPSLFSGHLIGDQDSKNTTSKCSDTMCLDLSSQFLLPLMNICPKCFTLFGFPLPTIFQELIPLILCTACLHPEPKERDQLLHILFNLIKRPDDEQRCVCVCVLRDKKELVFLCQRSRTNRNWILLDDFNQVSLKLIFCWYSVDKFMWTSGLSISMTCTFQLLKCKNALAKLQCNISVPFLFKLKCFVKMSFKIIIFSNG